MKYSDHLADAIIERFNLNPVTKRVWKTRDAIPDKYFEPGAVPSGLATQEDETTIMRLLEILRLPEISEGKFVFGASRIRDFLAGKRRITQNDLIQLKTEIAQLRTKISKLVKTQGASDILSVVQEPRFHPTHVLGIRVFDKYRQGNFLTDLDLKEIQGKAIRLYNLLRL